MITIAAIVVTIVIAFCLYVMDMLTYGGLFKNPTWQRLRKLWDRRAK